jgi:hypothetical protein
MKLHGNLRFVALPEEDIDAAEDDIPALILACPSLVAIDVTSVEIQDSEDLLDLCRLCRGQSEGAPDKISALLANSYQMYMTPPDEMDPDYAMSLSDQDATCNVLRDWEGQLDQHGLDEDPAAHRCIDDSDSDSDY